MRRGFSCRRGGGDDARSMYSCGTRESLLVCAEFRFGAESGMDVRQAIEELAGQFADRPNLDVLKGVRQRIDDPAFASAITEFSTRGHNDPSVRIDFKKALRSLLRAAQDRKSDLDYEATQVGRIGIGGGVGLVGGSVVAAATAAFPIVVLIPVLGGAVVTGLAFLRWKSAESRTIGS